MKSPTTAARSMSTGARLYRIERMLVHLLNQQGIEMAEIDDLKAEVARNTDVEKSALALITGLHDQLAAAVASGNMKAVADITATLKANDDELAASVAANTPAA